MYFPHCTRRLIFLTVIVFVVGLPCKAAHADDKFRALNISGTHYSNACWKSEQLKLWKVISGKVKDAPGAKRVLHTILCVPRTGPERAYLASLFPLKIREKAEGTGQEPSFEVVRRSDELIDGAMAAGEAWSAEVEVEQERIKLQYVPGEACMRGIALSYRQAKWMIDEISEACD